MGNSLDQGAALPDFFRCAGIKPFAVFASEGDADTGPIRRFGDDPAEAADGVEHLDAGMTGDVITVLGVGDHAIAAAIRPGGGSAKVHEPFSGQQFAIVGDDEAPDIGAAVFGNDEEFMIRGKGDSIGFIDSAGGRAGAGESAS